MCSICLCVCPEGQGRVCLRAWVFLTSSRPPNLGVCVCQIKSKGKMETVWYDCTENKFLTLNPRLRIRRAMTGGFGGSRLLGTPSPASRLVQRFVPAVCTQMPLYCGTKGSGHASAHASWTASVRSQNDTPCRAICTRLCMRKRKESVLTSVHLQARS